MPQILHYSPRPTILQRYTLLLSQWCWLVFALAALVPLWHMTEPLFRMPSPIYAGDAQEYWQSVAGFGFRQIYEVDRNDTEVIYAMSGCGRSPGPFYRKVNTQDLNAKRFCAAEMAALLVGYQSQRGYGYLKAVTGQDFGSDKDKWFYWVQGHTEATGIASAYRSALDERSRELRAKGASYDEWDIESEFKALYRHDVKECGHLTWRISIAMLSYILLVALARRLNPRFARWCATLLQPSLPPTHAAPVA